MVKLQLPRLCALIIFATLFVCCENDKMENSSNFEKKNLVTNPYDYVGDKHNQKLTEFAKYLNGDTALSISDLYDFNLKRGTMDAKSLSDYEDELMKSLVLSYAFMYENENALDTIFEENVVLDYIKRFRTTMLGVLNTSVDAKPSEFNDMIADIEQDIMADGFFNNEENKEYEVLLLSTMAIAKSSYSYWYSAYYDVTHPWHNVVITTINHTKENAMSKEDKPKKGFWGKVLTAVKCVAAVVAYVPADVIGAAGAGNTVVTREGGQEVRTTEITSEMIEAGADASSSVWEWATN